MLKEAIIQNGLSLDVVRSVEISTHKELQEQIDAFCGIGNHGKIDFEFEDIEEDIYSSISIESRGSQSCFDIRFDGVIVSAKVKAENVLSAIDSELEKLKKNIT